MKPLGKTITKDFYQRAASPVITFPEQLVHADVEQVAADFSPGSRPLFFLVDLPARTMAMTVGMLQPAQHSTPHRHSYESLMYITEGEGYTMLEDRHVDWRAGDAIYVPVWTWHHNVNTSATNPAKYVSCDNAPLLHQLGLAMFEPGS